MRAKKKLLIKIDKITNSRENKLRAYHAIPPPLTLQSFFLTAVNSKTSRPETQKTSLAKRKSRKKETLGCSFRLELKLEAKQLKKKNLEKRPLEKRGLSKNGEKKTRGRFEGSLKTSKNALKKKEGKCKKKKTRGQRPQTSKSDFWRPQFTCTYR